MTAEAAVSDIEARAFSILDARCGKADEPIAVAVSGGGDSTALLLIASDWARERGKSLHILTVNHGLRPDAERDIDFVLDMAARLGHSADVLTLNPSRTGNRWLRADRHRAIANAARRAGAGHILLGHTFDDQLETFLIRCQQGSTWFGLGGMDVASVSPVWPNGRGQTLVRPLLACIRAELRRYLRWRNQTWRDDPSNEDLAHVRVRMRGLLAKNAVRAASVSAFQGLNVLRRLELAALASAATEWLMARADGSVMFQNNALSDHRRIRLLDLAIQLAAGHAEGGGLSDLASVLSRLDDNPDTAITYHGAWLWRGHDSNIEVCRDPGLVSSDQVQRASEIWDNRFIRCDAPQIEPAHVRARRGLPQGGGWSALAPGRLGHICDIWRQV